MNAVETELRARIADLEREREGLFDELAISYESLSSIYDLGADPSLLLSPELALDLIIERALAFEPNLRAVFWLVDDERLVPVRWRNTAEPTRRSAQDGLIGRALREGHGIIVNHRSRSEDASPELEHAHRIAVSPLMLGDRRVGALVVWHDDEGEFDSRLMALLTALSSQAALILEQDRLRQEAVGAERLRQEVEIGGHIQRSLLFGSAPADLSRVEIGTVAEASRQVDGDFFGFFTHGKAVFDVLVGDVMGKGVPAALVGAAVKSQFLRFASTLLPSGEQRPSADPSEIVTAVHRETASRLIELDRFVTTVYARFDLDQCTMTYVDCGHAPILHCRGRDGQVRSLSQKFSAAINLPLGVLQHTRYEQATVPFEPDDLFLFYSDGITEALGRGDEMFGATRLAEALAAHRDVPAQMLADAICDRVRTFAGSRTLKDDLTCVAVRLDVPRTAAPAPHAAPRAALEVPATRGQLERVRDFAGVVCASIPGAPLDEGAVGKLQLALTEAVSNVVRHAYDEHEEGLLRIEASWDDEAVRVELIDTGRPFQPTKIGLPAEDGSREGGVGLYVIHRLMDEVVYARDEQEQNRLRLVLRFGGDSA